MFNRYGVDCILIDKPTKERLELRIKSNGGRKKICEKFNINYVMLTTWINGFQPMPKVIYNRIINMPMSGVKNGIRE